MRREGRGLPRAPARVRVGFSYLFWNHAWKLIRLNLLFLACCIPVVTMPAALCAMDRVLIVLVREGNVLLWRSSGTNLKRTFGAVFRSDCCSADCCFWDISCSASAWATSAPFSVRCSSPSACLPSASRSAAAAMPSSCAPWFDLPNGQILKNANGMSALRGGRGWLPIVVHGVGFLFGFSFFPYTLIVIALFGISLPQYLICYLLNDPIQKNIISPWERMQAQKET